jgi:putative ABC transport system permease protein
MGALELLRFSLLALRGHRLRSGLSLLGVAIGVAAVVVLTALGEGARRYVTGQFAGLGSNLLILFPGRTETTGMMPGIGGVPHDLTLEDAQAVARLPGVRAVAPVSMATEVVSHGERRRQLAVLGTSREMLELRQLRVAEGDFLRASELQRGDNTVVLGAKAARELFPGAAATGRVLRVGDRRMRVIGVLAPRGVHMGLDMDDLAVVQVATGMRMFNRSSLFRLLIQAETHSLLEPVRGRALRLLAERHKESDVTCLTQETVVSTFSGILSALTLALAAIAAISLSVAGIGIMNVMLVSVAERTEEVGLLRALGVARGQLLAAFLVEAACLSSAGGLGGVLAGFLAVRVLVGVYPELSASPPAWAVLSALAVSLSVGLVFGVLPARRATRLDPVAALARR